MITEKKRKDVQYVKHYSIILLLKPFLTSFKKIQTHISPNL